MSSEKMIENNVPHKDYKRYVDVVYPRDPLPQAASDGISCDSLVLVPPRSNPLSDAYFCYAPGYAPEQREGLASAERQSSAPEIAPAYVFTAAYDPRKVAVVPDPANHGVLVPVLSLSALYDQCNREGKDKKIPNAVARTVLPPNGVARGCGVYYPRHSPSLSYQVVGVRLFGETTLATYVARLQSAATANGLGKGGMAWLEAYCEGVFIPQKIHRI